MLTTLLQDNKQLLDEKVDASIIERFLRLIRDSGPARQYMAFLKSICTCKGAHIVKNQELLLKMVLSASKKPNAAKFLRNRQCLLVETALYRPKDRSGSMGGTDPLAQQHAAAAEQQRASEERKQRRGSMGRVAAVARAAAGAAADAAPAKKWKKKRGGNKVGATAAAAAAATATTGSAVTFNDDQPLSKRRLSVDGAPPLQPWQQNRKTPSSSGGGGGNAPGGAPLPEPLPDLKEPLDYHLFTAGLPSIVISWSGNSKWQHAPDYDSDHGDPPPDAAAAAAAAGAGGGGGGSGGGGGGGGGRGGGGGSGSGSGVRGSDAGPGFGGVGAVPGGHHPGYDPVNPDLDGGQCGRGLFYDANKMMACTVHHLPAEMHADLSAYEARGRCRLSRRQWVLLEDIAWTLDKDRCFIYGPGKGSACTSWAQFAAAMDDNTRSMVERRTQLAEYYVEQVRCRYRCRCRSLARSP